MPCSTSVSSSPSSLKRFRFSKTSLTDRNMNNARANATNLNPHLLSSKHAASFLYLGHDTPVFLQQLIQFFKADLLIELAAVCNGDAARFLGNHHGERICHFRYTDCRTMPRTQAFRNLAAVRKRQI